MRRILELLEADPRLTTHKVEAQTHRSPAVVERAVRGLEAEAKITVHGDRITRREIIYDEKGRVAGEEIVHESGRRDAITHPETVRIGPAGNEIQGTTLNITPDLPEASIAQDDRPGWRASCRPITGKPGHGALLMVKSTGEHASHFRCRLVRPDGSVVDSPLSAFDEHEKPQTNAAVRYPVHFDDPPPLGEGEYRFHWLGLVGRAELLLASGSFKLNTLGQVCIAAAHPAPTKTCEGPDSLRAELDEQIPCLVFIRGERRLIPLVGSLDSDGRLLPSCAFGTPTMSGARLSIRVPAKCERLLSRIVDSIRWHEVFKVSPHKFDDTVKTCSGVVGIRGEIGRPCRPGFRDYLRRAVTRPGPTPRASTQTA